MPELLLGVVVLILLYFAANGFAKADPKRAARLLRRLGGGGALVLAAFLLSRGEIGPAVTVGALGLGLLGWVSLWPAGFWRRGQGVGGVSRLRSAFVEIELDHTSGAMHGRMLAGRHAGAVLDALDAKTLVSLLGEIDDDSRRLLTAYLDRRAPGWREYAQRDAAAGGSGRAASSGKMTEQEAYQILGLQSGAGPQEIARAHRSLIKKLHPDQGGSTYLAARVNEAKDVLLRRHR